MVTGSSPIMRGGEDVWLSLSEAVMRDPSGGVAGRIFAFRDISAERVVEQMKSDFVSTVSLELRTPLPRSTASRRRCSADDVSFSEDGAATSFLGYIASESERLTRIVDALLNVARIDTGNLAGDAGPTDVRALVGDVQAVRSGHRARTATVRRRPRGRRSVTANADPEKLRQVLDALVYERRQVLARPAARPVSSASPADAIGGRRPGRRCRHPASEQDRIFSKFYEREQAARAPGFGLFIARGLVRAMGGAHVGRITKKGADRGSFSN